MNHSIYITACNNYQTNLVTEKIEFLFSQLAVTQTLTKDTKVLLKPNLLSKMPPEKAVTTHPEVVRGVIRACVKRGVLAKNIVIADSAGGLYNTKQTKALYQGCGLTPIAQEESATLYTDCQWELVQTQGTVVSAFNILKPVLEADFIINLPKFKTHVMTGLTAGCKNMFGCVPGLDKSQWHTRFPERDPFGNMLIDLYQLVTPTFSLLDGILAMEGDGPGGGTPRELGVLLASEDTLHLDLAVAHMMGLSPLIVPYLKAAYQRQLCGSSVDLSQVFGDIERCSLIPHWKLPKSYENGAVGSTSFVASFPKFLQPLGRKLESSLAPRPFVKEDECVNCKRCSEICSKHAISFHKNKARIDKNRCILCFCCHEVCPVKAIDIKKSPLSPKTNH